MWIYLARPGKRLYNSDSALFFEQNGVFFAAVKQVLLFRKVELNQTSLTSVFNVAIRSRIRVRSTSLSTIASGSLIAPPIS